MTKQEIEELIAKVELARSRCAEREAKHEERRKKIMGAAVRSKLDEADEQHEEDTQPVRKKLANLEAKLKDAVVTFGESVKGETVIAVYTPPAKKWDNAKLEGLSLAHPEILKCRTVAESGTCAIRNNKEK